MVVGWRRKEGRARSALEIDLFKQLPWGWSTSATNVSAEEPFHVSADTGSPGQEEPSLAQEAQETRH